ncbi:WXG100 family type VII secretion target [Streptacidiphilus fuscans]|uniref:WXG100 family type VII secretion target n=1 Tax=Streptacidiphilus fuscans TaxID=2789292 RepID=A0A931AXP5_9ACTN|nr:WXG100 family type VII secretion target [Streptacidiphilus fuscans]MBF9067319.1 WXG100 family type VII secretion target [Streptacidiphilus fuscans]
MGLDINAAIAGKVAQVLSLLDLPWPGGDPAALRRLAGNWNAMAAELEQTAQHLDVQVGYVVGPHWSGAAAEAFQQHWSKQHDAMAKSAQSFRQVAKELEAYADQAESIIEAIVDIALQIAEFELAGALLTVFTAGISDAVSAAASGERALKIVQLIDKFIKMAEKAEKVITELIEDIRKLGMLPRIAMDALKNTVSNLGSTELGNVMSGHGLALKGSDLEGAALSGAGGAGLSGIAGALGGKIAKGAAEDGAGSKIGAFLQGDTGFSNVAMGGLTNAGGGAIADGVQHKGGRDIAADAVTNLVSGGAASDATANHKVDPLPSEGRHAAPGDPYTPIGFDLGANAESGWAGGGLENAVNQNPTLPQQGKNPDGAMQEVS